MGVNVGTHLCIRRPGREIQYLCRGPWIPRNYWLYGLMAGVRGPVRLFEPRGVPDDANSRLKWELRDGKHAADEYAQSWLTTDELRAVARAYESEPTFQAEYPGQKIDVGPHFAATIGAMEALDEWCREHGGGQAILAFSFS